MESLLNPNPLSSRNLPPFLRTTHHSLPHPLNHRRLHFIHFTSATPSGCLRLPRPSFLCCSLRPLQPLKPPANIGVSILEGARKTLALAIFAVAVSLLPFPAARLLPAVAALAVSENSEKGETFTDHEFSGYTRRLLSVVSVLLRRIEEVQSGKGDMSGVKKALREVKASRMHIQAEVIKNLNAELKELKIVDEELTKRSDEVFQLALSAVKKRDMLLASNVNDEETKGMIEELERNIGHAEKEYDDLWVQIGEIEDRIMRRETLTYSIAVRELSFIEKESDLLVQRFGRRMLEFARERTGPDFHTANSRCQRVFGDT